MALELILSTLLKSNKFLKSTPDEKDWQSIAKLIPGATPKQCAKKWEELSQNGLLINGVAQRNGYSDELNTVVEFLLVSKESGGGSDEDDNVVIMKHKEHQNIDETTCKKEQDQNSKANKSEDVVDPKKDPLSSSMKKLKPKPVTPDGPNMVIHVCDESKNLKQDFSCPRDLLVKEMKYFAEYLSLEPQRWEEVDISVHCDVKIFDWLMHYAKRDLTNSEDAVPKLEANNVISILISSDFLKMDSLVTKCIHYCHAHMSTILSTPCNMNCINSKLVTRISKLFSHTELDAVKDKKDKFKSKLFCKKIEEFINGSLQAASPDNASTLFRCSSCKKLLTSNSQTKIPCVINRMNIDSHGQMSYCHIRLEVCFSCGLDETARTDPVLGRFIKDVSWDVNDFLLGLKEKLKSWRDVYWRLWGSVMVLHCHHCHGYFPTTDLGHCRYHTQTVEYSEGQDATVVGIYPCCQQKVLRYDSLGVLTGCQVKDHLIKPLTSPNLENSENNKNEESEKNGSKAPDDVPPAPAGTNDCSTMVSSSPGHGGPVNDASVVRDLLARRDVICLPFQRAASARTSELNIFDDDEQMENSKLPAGYVVKTVSSNANSGERKTNNDSAALPPIRRSKTGISLRMPSSRRKTAILRNDDYSTTSTDEEEDEAMKYNSKAQARHFHRAKKKHSAESRQSSSFIWDPQRPKRWNQDAQREEDSKRMNEVITAMAKLRSAANQEKKQKSKEFAGGIFHKLEHQFRISSQPPPPVKHQSSNNQLTAGSRSRRPVVKS